MARSKKSPVELASDLGSKAYDLLQHGDVAAEQALTDLASLNPELFAWLLARLVAATSTTRPELAKETT